MPPDKLAARSAPVSNTREYAEGQDVSLQATVEHIAPGALSDVPKTCFAARAAVKLVHVLDPAAIIRNAPASSSHKTAITAPCHRGTGARSRTLCHHRNILWGRRMSCNSPRTTASAVHPCELFLRGLKLVVDTVSIPHLCLPSECPTSVHKHNLKTSSHHDAQPQSPVGTRPWRRSRAASPGPPTG